MKKILLSFLITVTASCCAFAFELSDTHTHNSAFWKNSSALVFHPAYGFTFGPEFDIIQHRKFDNDIYAFRLPITINPEQYDIMLKPFWYPDNANGAKAFGGKILLATGETVDDIDQNSSRAYVGAGFAAQKADVLRDGTVTPQKYFYQTAYEAGMNYNYFGQYSFDVNGNIYQYLSGISGVDDVKGVMNQQEIADLGTTDYLFDLPKGSAGLKIRWYSPVNKSENYISYRYIGFYNASAAHSLLLGSSLSVISGVHFSLTYNHIFQHSRNRDIYGAGLTLGF